MNYNKPAIEVLGEAVRVIQGSKPQGFADGQTQGGQSLVNSDPPAYELDE